MTAGTADNLKGSTDEILSLPKQCRRLTIVLIVAAAFCGLLLIRFPTINGTPFHLLPFRWIASGRVYPAMLLGALPALIAQRVRKRAVGVVLLMTSTLSLQLIAAGIAREPFDLDRMGDIVNSPWSTSYFTDAQLLTQRSTIAQWLPVFPTFSSNLHLHSRQKPPGQILYFLAWLRLYPMDDPLAIATNSGILIAVLTTLALPACYAMARCMIDVDAAFATTTFFSLSPGFLLFCPSFDAVYPAATCVIVGSWVIATRVNSWKVAVAAALVCGGTTALLSFMAYVVLTLGAFCAMLAVFRLKQRRVERTRMLLLIATVLGSIAAFYTLLWLALGFDPFATMAQAIYNERAIRASMKMPHVWPHTLLRDWQDFFFAQGWLSVPLLVWGLFRIKSVQEPLLVWLAVAQILIVWSTGIMAPETARLWLYLQPLAMLLIGLELVRWRPWARLSVYCILAVVTACMTQNVLFISDTVYR